MSAAEPRSGGSRAWGPLSAIAIVAASLLAHGGGLDGVFHYDDKVEILLNRPVTVWGQWGDLWAYNPFRFLLLATFALQMRLTGADPVPMHVVNLAIHTLNAGLVAWLAGRVLALAGPARLRAGWPRRLAATATGLLFAVHPLLVEAVTYIAGRSSSLATTVYLLAFVLLDSLLRRESASADAGARFTAAATRVGLLMTLGIGVLAAAAASYGLLVRLEIATPARALPLALGVAVFAAALAGGPARTLVRRPLPAGPPTGGLMLRWGGLAALFAIGALTKEIVATLPIGLWLWDLCLYRGGDLRAGLRRATGLYAPLIAGPVALLLFRLATYGTLLDTVLVRPYTVNVWTEAVVVWRYVGLFVWPSGLSIFHDHPESASALGWPASLAIAAWLGVLAWTVAGLRRRPGVAFAVLWSLLAIAPSSSVIPLKETMAEHRAYLPMVGWCLLPALLGGELFAGRARAWTVGAAIALLCVPLGWRTVGYTRLWSSEVELWTRAVTLNPHAAPAWYMLGDIARIERRPGDAVAYYERCLQEDPTFHDAANNLGLVHAEQGDLAHAEQRFEQARDIATLGGGCSAPAYNNLANVAMFRRRHLEAVRHHLDALACDDENYVALVGLGNLYYGALDEPARALDYYRRAVRVRPDHPASRQVEERIEELSW